jgi:ABC-type sugar transport system permease subunit
VWRRWAGGYGPFIVPAGLCITLLIALPLLVMLWLSLMQWNLTQARLPRFAGLVNWVRLAHDAAFWRSLATSLQFTVETVTLQLVAGVGIAVLFNRDWPGMGAIRAAFLAPMMIAPVFVGMIWRLLLSDDFGIVKFIFQLFGIFEPPLWLDDPAVALHTVAIVSAWEWSGFVVLFVLAGLQTIPAELYEAASLDGCGKLRAFTAVTLPLLRPVLGAVILFRAIDAIKTFDIIYAMTAGGPGESTTTTSWLVYQQALVFFDLGYAGTLALVMLGVVAALSTPLVWRTR